MPTNWYIQEGYKEGLLYRYAPNAKILRCPGDKRKNDPGQSHYYYNSYSGVEGLNGGGGPTAGIGNNLISHNATPILKVSGLKHTSERFLWVEENDNRGDEQGSWWFDPGTPYGSGSSWIDCPAVYHVISSTFSFADGHAESRRWFGGNTIPIATAGNAYGVASPSPNADLTYVVNGYPCVENP